MNLDQAGVLIKFIETHYPRLEMSLETKKMYGLYLRPLPFEWAFAKVRLLVLRSKWPPTVAELTEALDIVDDDARRDLLRAISEGGSLERHLRSPNGWRLSVPGQPAQDVPRLSSGPTQGQGVRLLLKRKRDELERKRQAAADAALPPPATEAGA